MERAELVACLERTGVVEVRNGITFLCDPKWTHAERERVAALQSHPGVRGQSEDRELGWLCVPTGGTSGGVRFARHDEMTLTAAVSGFCEFFNISRVNAFDVLPAHHVSGLMARVRSAATGGRHVSWDWRKLEMGERPRLDPAGGEWVISLVPTQLQRLLSSTAAIDWLRGFRTIFIGGGPVWPMLMGQVTETRLPIALTYGMTETAAMIAAIKPEEFVQGAVLTATALPHTRVQITDQGLISIEGPSVFRGYFPEFRSTRAFETEDLGRLDEQGRLKILGRRDAVIITGGKKVNPSEVEAALRSTGQFTDVAVVGLPDQFWGETVVACYPETNTRVPDFEAVERELLSSLASHQRPKRYVGIRDWPRNAQGKLNRSELAGCIRRVKA